MVPQTPSQLNVEYMCGEVQWEIYPELGGCIPELGGCISELGGCTIWLSLN